MNANPVPGTARETIPPPRLITSLRAGFDTVARNIGLILFPIILDLFLWFGPHIQLKSLFQALMRSTANMPGMTSPQMAEILRASQEVWNILAERFNLVSALRTYPVGIPSLMATRLPVETPLGQPNYLDLEGLGNAILVWMALTLIGMILGSLYFSSVSRAVNGEGNQITIARDLWSAVQSILLAITWLIILAAISIPAFFLLSIAALISPGFAQIAILVFTIFLAWIVVPMLFSPHGIYVYRQNAFFSLLTSVRLVRFILPGTGLFFLAIILLSQGLDLLWQVPPHSSWMGLIGIGGHAFITTALVAASFQYYRDAMRWVQEFLQRTVIPQPPLKSA